MLRPRIPHRLAQAQAVLRGMSFTVAVVGLGILLYLGVHYGKIPFIAYVTVILVLCEDIYELYSLLDKTGRRRLLANSLLTIIDTVELIALLVSCLDIILLYWDMFGKTHEEWEDTCVLATNIFNVIAFLRFVFVVLHGAECCYLSKRRRYQQEQEPPQEDSPLWRGHATESRDSHSSAGYGLSPPAVELEFQEEIDLGVLKKCFTSPQPYDPERASSRLVSESI